MAHFPHVKGAGAAGAAAQRGEPRMEQGAAAAAREPRIDVDDDDWMSKNSRWLRAHTRDFWCKVKNSDTFFNHGPGELWCLANEHLQSAWGRSWKKVSCEKIWWRPQYPTAADIQKANKKGWIEKGEGTVEWQAA